MVDRVMPKRGTTRELLSMMSLGSLTDSILRRFLDDPRGVLSEVLEFALVRVKLHLHVALLCRNCMLQRSQTPSCGVSCTIRSFRFSMGVTFSAASVICET